MREEGVVLYVAADGTHGSDPALQTLRLLHRAIRSSARYVREMAGRVS
jgi:hypothetical protein